MNTIITTYNLLCHNLIPNNGSSDIYEHLPTLYKYARECDSVFETGVRGCVSSWAFLYGLLDGETQHHKTFFLNDITTCNIRPILEVSKPFDNITVKYEWKNNLLLDFTERYDLTFIDTWHVYGHLKRELDRWNTFVTKYIILHDTTVDGEYGETVRLGMNPFEQIAATGIPLEEIIKGLWPAVTEFLEVHPEWTLEKRYENNNGLTILARRSTN